MNININSTDVNIKSSETPKSNNIQSNSTTKFSDELKELEETKTKAETETQEKIETKENFETTKETSVSVKEEKEVKEEEISSNKVLDGAIQDLSILVNKLNQSEEKISLVVKKPENFVDNTQEGDELINNDFNINENKDIMPQMSPNMNFSGGQPFSSFMNNETNQNQDKKLSATAADLAEEAAILSTMAENIAIANKKQVISKTQKSEVLPENTVKFDTIIMSQADVEVFTTLVNKGEVNLNDIAPKSASRATQVSKTLADMLAKSMENNQPLRIDFDNDISVIIRISRDGKISADFLPSTQIAEAYLKENLPLLRQRFEDNNIEYDSLNHRNSKEREKEDSRKKGRNNE